MIRHATLRVRSRLSAHLSFAQGQRRRRNEVENFADSQTAAYCVGNQSRKHLRKSQLGKFLIFNSQLHNHHCQPAK